jgi:SAM-dependent methyltransferase
MSSSVIFRPAKIRIFSKSPFGILLRIGEWTWNLFPTPFTNCRLAQPLGCSIQKFVRLYDDRRQYFGTFFLRNRPQIELIKRLAIREKTASEVKLAVLGCSNGAEVYSIVAAIRAASPNINLKVRAVDISEDILRIARDGVYSVHDPGLAGSPMFQRMSPSEIDTMFEGNGEILSVRSWIRRGIDWHKCDVSNENLAVSMGQQDIVIANNFLCHMTPADAARCLRNIASVVRPGGHLIVSGVDLDVRAGVASELGWTPVTDLLKEIHNGDFAVRRDWPWRYWGVEPFQGRRADRVMRYTSVFRIGESKAARLEAESSATLTTV